MRTPTLAAALLTAALALPVAAAHASGVPGAPAARPSTSSTPARESERAAKLQPRSDAWAAEVVALTNVRRKRHGVKPLRAATCPHAFAAPWARHMAKTRDLVHHSSLAPLFTCHASSAGENIAEGYESARAVVRAWMSDKGHRDNLLNPHFHRIGVAGWRATNGATYAIQDFVG